MSLPIRKPYTARICWNSNIWTFPSGDASLSEKGSYVVKAGFGHEEWLFNFAWLINGFHYAFLQPVGKSFQNMTGRIIDVLLYTISPSGERLYVGEILDCEVLQPNQADAALKIYKKRKWLKAMAERVAAVEGKVDYILNPGNAAHLFNIRFRPNNKNIRDPFSRADRTDAVWNLQRYSLVAADPDTVKQWRIRKGRTTPLSVRTITRKGTPSITYDPIHKRLQADLLRLLVARYGKRNVTLENDNVDITVIDSQKKILIEIKTDPRPRAAIREALGQLLEYAYYWPQKAIGAIEMVVIAPGKLDKTAEQYIKHLRIKFNIPVGYCAHSEGDPLPGLFV